jgi:ArsR family transcriptional regulator, lead/cadmium/zinc/bismuth-responsive transcriptional repressor
MTIRPVDLLRLSPADAERLRRALPTVAAQAEMVSRAKAVSDPVRLGLALLLFHQEEACVTDLSWLVEQSVGLTSHHLKKLRQERLVEVRREHRTGLYRLTATGCSLLESLDSS